MHNRENTRKADKQKHFLVIIILFVIISIIPVQVKAAVLSWSNPNGKVSPYKIKLTDVINSKMLTQVVGCTGLVNKASLLIDSLSSAAWDYLAQQAVLSRAVAKACEKTLNAAATTIGATETAASPAAAKTQTIINTKEMACQSAKNARGDTFDTLLQTKRDAQTKATINYEQCFKGIGFTLAKNQLTAMTRYAVNWVNTGFGGDPFFVQNTQTFLNSIEQGVLEQSINVLLPDSVANYPNAAIFATSLIDYKTNRQLGFKEAISKLTSNLSSFMTSPSSLSDDEIQTITDREEENQTKIDKLIAQGYSRVDAVQKAINDAIAVEQETRAVESYNEDFMNGGWSAWFATTQNDNNNPIGYTYSVSKLIEEKTKAEKEQAQTELIQNNGFLSQRKCVKYGAIEAVAPVLSGDLRSDENKALLAKYHDKSNCIKWEVVTPGSIIKDQLSTYLTSPIRQLELADDINKVLNSVFEKLLNNLQSQGLSDINNGESYEYDNDEFNWTNSLSTEIATKNGESLSSGYVNGSFDLTRDLGNRFIFDFNKNSRLGTWNANANIAIQKNGNTEKLVEGVGPVVVSSQSITYPQNVYYVVTTGGRSKLFSDGYISWNVGDRAFWDGEKWQNWRCEPDANGNCTGQKYPIKERGVIQIQYDYIVAAKEMLQSLPKIMPKIGELDYCLPGPNLDWLNNVSIDTSSALSDLLYTLKAGTNNHGLSKKDTTTFTIDKPGTPKFDAYLNMFKGSPSMLSNVTVTNNPGNTDNPDNITYGTGRVAETNTWRSFIDIANGYARINKQESAMKKEADLIIDNFEDSVKQFNSDYTKIVDSIYGQNGLVNIEYFTHENSPERITNTAYVPVGKVAYPIAGQIVQYDEDINDKTYQYRDSIATVQAGVYELEKIKKEVDAIILKAQKRRDERMIEILNAEAQKTGGDLLTKDEYEDVYADCLDTEKIVFYDDLSIFNDKSSTEDRCSDGLDNDFDGLTDTYDPDCAGTSTTNSGEGVDDSSGGDAFGDNGDAFGDGGYAF